VGREGWETFGLVELLSRSLRLNNDLQYKSAIRHSGHSATMMGKGPPPGLKKVITI